MNPDTKHGLSVHNLGVQFGGIHALTGLNLNFNEEKVSAVIGPNGAGKSTLVNVLSGFQQQATGDVRLDGHVITGMSPQKINQAGISRTFQSPHILPGLSVLENVMLSDAARTSTRASAALLPWRVHRAEKDSVARAWAVLERFDLLPIALQSGNAISGGQQRLVELARMSFRAPRYLILDEPTAGVAPAMRQAMVDHLRRLRTETKACVVIIEHDMAVVEALADEVFVLAEGKLLSQGSMEQVRTNPRVIDAYLGAELPHRDRRRDQVDHDSKGETDAR